MFFSTKTITVEFGCSKANQPKVLADLSANIVFAYTYMIVKKNYLGGPLWETAWNDSSGGLLWRTAQEDYLEGLLRRTT